MFGKHARRLLFRSYLWLVGGLLAVAIALDLGFGYLQSGEQQDDKLWLKSTFRLISMQLENTPSSEHEVVIANLASELGVGVHLLARDEVYTNDIEGDRFLPLVDADGNVSYISDAKSVNAIIRLGPIATYSSICYHPSFICPSLWWSACGCDPSSGIST